ncbi:hypothetical protein QUS22_03985 [Wolbachia pipientis]|nr:hypothetical protein [Wolbachia pipientis]
MTSWPFQEAEKILQEFPNKTEIIFETGYGPSGLMAISRSRKNITRIS